MRGILFILLPTSSFSGFVLYVPKRQRRTQIQMRITSRNEKLRALYDESFEKKSAQRFDFRIRQVLMTWLVHRINHLFARKEDFPTLVIRRVLFEELLPFVAMFFQDLEYTDANRKVEMPRIKDQLFVIGRSVENCWSVPASPFPLYDWRRRKAFAAAL